MSQNCLTKPACQVLMCWEVPRVGEEGQRQWGRVGTCQGTCSRSLSQSLPLFPSWALHPLF